MSMVFIKKQVDCLKHCLTYEQYYNQLINGTVVDWLQEPDERDIQQADNSYLSGDQSMC